MSVRNASILIIDDDKDVLTALSLLLKKECGGVIAERNPGAIPGLLSKHSFDLVLLDMNFNATVNTGNEGIFWLRRIREIQPDLPVVLITAYADIDLAIRSLKEGAADFIIKPWNNQKLLETIRELSSGTRKPELPDPGNSGIIGQSELMQDILRKISKVAPTDANVLILGENGTGKDLIAHAIHEHSLRRDKPFVKVDVGSLTESLFESELFGHKKGAFTDAREDREGRFESASGGSVFLDEIGNISLQQQAKLLTVLQNRVVTRLGNNTPVPIDIRLICATNLPLSQLANEERFRKDLIYRINTIEITVPPLRSRVNDIPLLAEHYLAFYSRRYFRPLLSLTPGAMEKLMSYPFPGNVRELQYCIERAVIMADRDRIFPEDLIFSPIEQAANPAGSDKQESRLSAVEKQTILRVIEKNNGNITRAAKELGITRTALYRRLGKYEI